VIYANNAGTSWPKPPSVVAAVERALLALPQDNAEAVQSSGAAVCRFLNLPHPERLLFTTGCTSALAVAMGDLPWERDDVVVTSALEHHAVSGAVERLALARGIVHRVVPRAERGPIDLDFLRDALRAGGVRLVAMTAASNVTGELLPVREIADLAHEFGGLFLLDAAQTVGAVPTDVAAIGADIVAFAGHKGPRGPLGVGALWASRDVAFASPSAACEIPGPDAGAGSCRPFPGDCDVGGMNAAGVAGLGAGIAWHLDQSQPQRVGATARRLRRRLVEALAQRPHCRVLGEPGVPATGAVSIEVEGLPIEQAESWFERCGIVVRAGAHCAPMALAALSSPEGTIRISFGPDNRDEDVGAIAAAIDGAKRRTRSSGG
jgi:selenocysteine lyase/cysteine desulfurase